MISQLFNKQPRTEAKPKVSQQKMTDMFNYQYFDDTNNFLYMQDAHEKSIGFMLTCTPLLVAGVDAEPNIEALLTALPPDSVVMFSKLVSPQIEGYLRKWAGYRTQNNNFELLRFLTEKRVEYYLNAREKRSLLSTTKMHPMTAFYYVFVKIPFTGDDSDANEMALFMNTIKDLRGTVQGALKAAKMESAIMNQEEFKFLMRELLNPEINPDDRLAYRSEYTSIVDEIVDKNTRIMVNDGKISFANGLEKSNHTVMCLTVDAPPKYLYLPMMADTLGKPIAWDERITCPYWAYTIVHVLHPDKAKDDLFTKFGMMNKQTMSESAWYRSMMGPLYEKKDRAGALLAQLNDGHTLVRAYTGVNLYSNPMEVKNQTEYLKGLFRRRGFRITQETSLAMPAFIASMPFQYTGLADPANKGMQRGLLMSSLNAASMLQIQGDWKGTNLEIGGGLLLVSRAGQLATIDLFQTATNYNFIVAAASGSGKSFLTNEIVKDFLSRGGVVRIIDVGRSYARICNIMKGQNIVFSPENPLSLNPFTGVTDIEKLGELMPMIKELLRLMAYPLTPEEDTPAYEYQLMETAVTEVWHQYGEDSELRHIYEWFLNHVEDGQRFRAKDLAVQLAPYAIGRYRKWFEGRRTIEFKNPMIILELEELNQDSSLQAVVMQLIMFQVTKEMYLSSKKIPKLLAIDEAWAIMGGMRTGKFIETAFRRIRKYNGSAGVITQSFEDFEKSSASKAAIENAEWQFVLYQKEASIDFAAANKRIAVDDYSLGMMKSVKSGFGFSEIFVRCAEQQGLYRFIPDRHTYYTFTTNAKDTNKIDDLMTTGLTLIESIDKLAKADYARMWSSLS